MLSLGIVIVGLIFLLFGFLLWAYCRTDSFQLIIGVMIVVLTVVYWMQPDLWRWYHYESIQKRLKLAQSILKDPGRVQQLKESLKKHLKKDPQDAKAWVLLARISASAEEWTSVYEAIRHAYQLQPDDVKTTLFYVESLWHVEGYLSPKARRILLKILKKEPTQPDTLMLLATEAKQRHCPGEALGYLRTLRVVVASDTNITQTLDETILELKSTDNSQCIHSDET